MTRPDPAARAAPILALLALGAMAASAFPQATDRTQETTMTTMTTIDETVARPSSPAEDPAAFFDARMRDWLDGWAARDMDAIAAVYNAPDPSLRIWDPVPVPGNASGWDAYAGEVGPWLSTVTKLDYELHDDMAVRDLGDGYVTTRSDTTTITEEDGEPYAATVRRTLVWQEVGGSWRIVHEHTSAFPEG
jgi:ketosteroid isomerase-like protein